MATNFKDEIFQALEDVKKNLDSEGEINQSHLELLLLTSLLEEE